MMASYGELKPILTFDESCDQDNEKHFIPDDDFEALLNHPDVMARLNRSKSDSRVKLTPFRVSSLPSISEEEKGPAGQQNVIAASGDGKCDFCVLTF